jgi:ABC-type lipoprotein release transport system permease subunit
MILKNLGRRKGRTILTILSIGIGISAIIALGTLANGLEAGYNSMMAGSKADLVLSQPNAFDISFSVVDEDVGDTLENMPEVASSSGMLQGLVQSEDLPYFFVYGYPKDSFILDRFQIMDGVGLYSSESQKMKGTPILLGSAAAEMLNKTPGDSIRLMDSVYRIVGIYETGETLEDRGALLDLPDAQSLIGMQRQVSLFYIQLKDPGLKDRFQARVDRLWSDLSLSGTDDFASKQLMITVLHAYVIGIAGLAIVIGGVGMMNGQLMSVMERTHEIGVLRALGWSRLRVMSLILGESILVGIIGGLVGMLLGWLSLYGISNSATLLSGIEDHITSTLLLQAFTVVLPLGIIGGLYPAWRASQLEPVEALRYEGGTMSGSVRRLPVGGMAVQSLWQRIARTLLTLGAIGLTVGGISAMEGVIRGAGDALTDIATGTAAEIMIRQADAPSSSQSILDQRIGTKLAVLPEVDHVSGIIMTAVNLPEAGSLFMLQGYAPNEFAIRRINVVEGNLLTGNHQILLGGVMAEALGKGAGDTIQLGGKRFRIIGVFETGVAWEEMGGIITLRDAQSFIGRPRKVTMYAVKVENPAQAEGLVMQINAQFPEAYAALSGEFVEQTPDMKLSNLLLNSISVLAVGVGGVGVLNTMLMAVLERTREIGVLRALGWRRRNVLGLIMREALLLGFIGGIVGIGIALGITYLMGQAPTIGEALTPIWGWDIFIRSLLVAVILGLVGGLYPAYRATQFEPVEALRYE